MSVPQPLANSGFQQAPQAPGPQPAPVFGGGSSMLGPMRSNVPPFGSAYNSVAANLSSGLGLSHQDSAKILSSECPEDAISPPRPDAKHNESPHGKLRQPSCVCARFRVASRTLFGFIACCKAFFLHLEQFV